jgi:hypothetical protein
MISLTYSSDGDGENNIKVHISKLSCGIMDWDQLIWVAFVLRR